MIRYGTPNDCDTFYRLICELEGTQLPFDAFSAIYQEQLQDQRYCRLVYEKEGAAVGILNLRVERQLHHSAWIAEILELVVSPACRSSGVGKALLEEACRIAADRGCVQMEVACNQLRGDAHRFYEREGMRNSHFKFSKTLAGKGRGEP